MRFSLSEFLSDMTADGTTIALDMPGGGYDRLHQILERKVSLPTSIAGRTAVIACLLTASRLVKQQLGPLSPLANFMNEIGGDAIREQSKRILEAAGRSVAARDSHGEPKTILETLLEMDGPSRASMLKQYRRLSPDSQRNLRAQMVRSTATELATLSGMSQEDFDALLDIMRPQFTEEHQPTAGMLDRIATGLFPWLKEK